MDIRPEETSFKINNYTMKLILNLDSKSHTGLQLGLGFTVNPETSHKIYLNYHHTQS